MATISRLLKIISLFCKRALQKRLYSAKETYNFMESTTHSHPIRKFAHRRTHTHNHSLALIHTHSLSQKNTLSPTNTHRADIKQYIGLPPPHSHTHKYTHIHTLTIDYSRTLTYTHSLENERPLTHTRPISSNTSVCCPLSHTRTRTHTYTCTCTITHSRTLLYAHSVSPKHFLTHTHTQCRHQAIHRSALPTHTNT